jgi:hypothetical protein
MTPRKQYYGILKHVVHFGHTTLGVATTESELGPLNESDGRIIPGYPHHPKLYAVDDVADDDQTLLSFFVGPTVFVLDMLENGGNGDGKVAWFLA